MTPEVLAALLAHVARMERTIAGLEDQLRAALAAVNAQPTTTPSSEESG